jgi:periplasmic mercuric ion binding protein
MIFVAFNMNAQTDAFTLRVEGLGCPFCAYGLEKKFKDVKGIKNIKIEIQTGKMTYIVPSENKMTLKDADSRVTKAGYTAKGIAVVRADGKKENSGDVNSNVAPTPMDSKTANLTKESFKVSGNCEMCKARIDKTAKSVAGVKTADWNVESKILTIEYDKKKAKLSDIQKAIAKSGHDNTGSKTSETVYNNLPACCQYR